MDGRSLIDEAKRNLFCRVVIEMFFSVFFLPYDIKRQLGIVTSVIHLMTKNLHELNVM